MGERERQGGGWCTNIFLREEIGEPRLEEVGPGQRMVVEQKSGKIEKSQTAKENKHQTKEFRLYYYIGNRKTEAFK